MGLLEDLQAEKAAYERKHGKARNPRNEETLRRRENQAVGPDAPRADHLVTDEEAEKIRKGMNSVP